MADETLVGRGAAESSRQMEIGFGGDTMWVAGEIDMGTADRLYTELIRCGEESTHEPLLVDMSGVTFVDSVGLRALIQASRTMLIQIVRPSTFVSTLLFVTGAEDTFGVG